MSAWELIPDEVPNTSGDRWEIIPEAPKAVTGSAAPRLEIIDEPPSNRRPFTARGIGDLGAAISGSLDRLRAGTVGQPPVQPAPAPVVPSATTPQYRPITPRSFGNLADKIAETLDRNNPELGTPSRQSSQISNIARGAGRAITSLPQAAGINAAELGSSIQTSFDRIDRGEKVSPWEVPEASRYIIDRYAREGTEGRAAIRNQYKGPTDPRETTMYQAGAEAQRRVEQAFPVNPEYQQDVGQKIPHAIGQGAGFLATGAAGRMARLPGVVTAAVPGAAIQGVEQFKDAVNKGASLEDAFTASKMGTVVGTSEALPIVRVLDRFDRATGGSVRNVLKQGLKGGTEEGLQEVGQQLASNLIASGVVKYDPERGTFEGVGEAGGVGFTVGGLFSVLATMLGAKMRGAPKIEQREQDQFEIIPDEQGNIPGEGIEPTVTTAPAEDVPFDVPLPPRRPEAPPINIPGSTAAQSPVNLTEYLVRKGGVKESGGELGIMGITSRARPGLLNNQTGMNLDDAALAAYEAGFFPELQDRPTINQFLDALNDDFNRRRLRYDSASEASLERQRWEMDVTEEADKLGIPVAGRNLEDVWEEVNRALGSGTNAMVRRLPPPPRIERTEQGDQYVIEGTEPESRAQIAQRQRQRQIEEARIRARGPLRPTAPQQDLGPLFEDTQDTLFSRGVDYSAQGPGRNYVPLVENVEARNEPATPPEGAAVEGPRPAPITREAVLGKLVKGLALPAYQGRIKSKQILGFARKSNYEVRTKRDADIEVAAHEYAHILDYKFPEIRKQWLPASNQNKPEREELKGLSYDKGKVYEGFAEFVRLWATQPAEAQKRAPNFHRWFERFIDRNEFGPVLREAQQDFSAWFAQDPLARARSKVGLNENINDVMASTSDRFRQAVLDDLQGILAAERTLFGKPPSIGGYVTARLARAAASITGGAIKWGAPKMESNGRIVYVDAKGNPSTILKPLKGGGNEVVANPQYQPWGLEQILKPVANRLDDFGMYAVGRRAKYLAGKGKEHLFTPIEIKGMLALETPEFQKAFADFQIYNKQLLDWAQSHGGLINPIGREAWSNDFYIPFWRVSHGSGKRAPSNSGTQKLIRELHGGTQNLGDPVENLFQNTRLLVEASIVSHARRTVVDEITKQPGSAKFLVRIPKDDKVVKISTLEVIKRFWQGLGVNPNTLPPEVQQTIEDAFDAQGPLMEFLIHNQNPVGNDLVAIMRGGKSEFYQVADPLLFRALMSLPRKPTASVIMRALQLFRRVGQATITYSFDFMYRNFVRDQVMAATMSERGFIPFVSAAKGMKARIASDPVYQEYIANGGGIASFLADDATAHRQLEAFYAKRGISYQGVVNTARKWATMAENFADSFEMATRLGYFEKGLAKGLEPRRAAFESRELSADFAMRGGGLPLDHPMSDKWDQASHAMNVLYDSVLFLKAGAVGMDRVYRGFSSQENRGVVAGKTAAIAMAGLLLYLHNYDNPLFDALPEWDKNSHYHIFIPRMDASPDAPLKDQYLHLRLPRAWEIGGIGAIVERAVEGFLKAQPKEATKAIVEIIRDMFRYEFLPQAIQPLYEQSRNRLGFLDRPIENLGEQDLPPWMRAENASETMRRFGKNVIRHLPRDLQLSPDRIEALLKGYLHTAAIYGLTLSDAIFFDDAPDIRIDQYPLIRSIYSKQPRSKHVNEFYDMLSEATEARRAMRELYRQNEFALGNQQAVSQEQIEFGLLSRTAKGLQTLTSLQQRTADAAGKEGLKPIIAQLTRMDISGKAKFAIASEKDVGALKREIIDAISDLKASIAKGAIERAGKLREKRPEIVPRIMRSLPVPPRRDGAVTAPREGLLQ